jgi:DNA-directed RNA polymerase specialized sigma24 family protein
MIYFDGMSVSEAAKELSKNPGTILQHRDRALEKLARSAQKLGVCR